MCMYICIMELLFVFQRFPLPGSRGVPLPLPQVQQVPHFRPLRPQRGLYYRTDTPQAFSHQVFPARFVYMT